MGAKRKHAEKDGANSLQSLHKRSKLAEPALKTPTAKSLATKTPFVDNPTGDERKREAELYDRLGSEDDTERLRAADAVISCLLDDGGVPGGVLARHLEKRLFRGLASGRKASRLGFSVVLTEILRQLFGKADLAGGKYSGLTFDKILNILVKSTDAKGITSGQEERDHHFGRLFGIECFLRADVLFADKTRWQAVLDMLLRLAEKKVWIRSQCGFVITQAIQQMDCKVADETLRKLAEEGFAKSAEGVAIWITAFDRFPKLHVKQPWAHPLASSAISSLPAILKDSGKASTDERPSTEGKQQQKNWTPQLHFVWDIVLVHFTRLGDEAQDDFRQFWNRVVDEGFFAKNASDNQKFSGFLVFQKMLEGGSVHRFMMSSIFSRNFMACLMNQSAKEHRHLHRAATKALEAMESVVQQNPVVLGPILEGLLRGHGAYNFDERTNTKTVEKLLQHTTPGNVTAVLEALEPKMPGDHQTGKPTIAYGNYLARLASLGSKRSGDDAETDLSLLQGKALQSLIKLAYSTPALQGPVKEQLRIKVSSSAARFIKHPEDLQILCPAIVDIDSTVALHHEKGSKISEEVLLPALKNLLDLLDSKKDTQVSRGRRQALSLLYAVTILQLYNEDPDAVDLLKELGGCYQKMQATTGEDEKVAGSLVEILLALVTRPSSLMRQVSQQVFQAFTHVMSADALQLLTEPLAAEENAKGHKVLFSTEQEDLEGDVDEDSDEETLDSDVEVVDIGDVEPDEEGSSDDEDDKKEENENSTDELHTKTDVKERKALDSALAEALMSHRLDEDADAAESDDSDMTDSEMMALDGKLAEIFKHHAKASSKKKDNKDAKEAVVNFKRRVLDLLAVFVNKEARSGNPLAFDVLLPLLKLMRTTTKPLARKASEIILKFSKLSKKALKSKGPAGGDSEGDTAPMDTFLALLEDIHAEAAKDMSHAFAKAVSSASLAVVRRVCATKDRHALEKVLAVYSKTQLRLCLGEVKIQASFFEDWLNWCQSRAVNNAAA